MNAAQIVADRLDECFDHIPGEDEAHDPAECALEALAENGFAVVELPNPDGNGEYANRADGKPTLTSVKADSAYHGEPMVALDTSSVRTFYRADRAREVAAALLAAAAAADAMKES